MGKQRCLFIGYTTYRYINMQITTKDLSELLKARDQMMAAIALNKNKTLQTPLSQISKQTEQPIPLLFQATGQIAEQK